jgi:hypothetical protein
VDCPAAPDDEHSLVPERGYRFPERKVAGRVEMLLDGELDDRDFRSGKHQHQRYPCPVIETTAGVGVAGEPCCLHKTGDPSGEVRISLRRVRDPVEFMRKPGEIMDGRGFHHGIRGGLLRVPVCGYAENRSDCRVPVAKAGEEPVSRNIRFERQGRGTVRDEKGRERFRGHEGVWIRKVKKAADRTGLRTGILFPGVILQAKSFLTGTGNYP